MAEVLQRKFQEQIFTRDVLFELFSNGNIVNHAVLDGMLEGGRIKGQARHRKFINGVFELAAVQQVTSDVVYPQTLPKFVQLLGCFHLFLLSRWERGFRTVRNQV